MRLFISILLIGTLAACGGSKPEKKFISATSLIRQQLQDVDTNLLYSIVRYRFIDTIPQDTAYLSKAEFRKEVTAFLEIPDLSDPKKASDYTEESRYDEALNRVIISYTSTKKGSFERIELFVEPDLEKGDQVKTILATRTGHKNNSEKEEMIWQIGRSCTRILNTQKADGTSESRSTKWSWKE
jgi:hypothetical protein